MYNNCALIGGIICLADVFLLGADSKTDDSVRFVKLCQVRKRIFLCTINDLLMNISVERFPSRCWFFYMLRWFISKTCSNISINNEKEDRKSWILSLVESLESILE